MDARPAIHDASAAVVVAACAGPVGQYDAGACAERAGQYDAGTDGDVDGSLIATYQQTFQWKHRAVLV